MLTRNQKPKPQTPNPKPQTPNPRPQNGLWKNAPAMLTVFARIANERSRQRELFHAGKITFDCASPLPDANRKLRVLVEEVGEVAQEMDRLENLRDGRAACFAREDLQEELVQVAAVAVAWLESLEAKPDMLKSEMLKGGRR